jgi:hypothetical protein
MDTVLREIKRKISDVGNKNKDNLDNPIVLIKLSIVNSNRAWYVTNGEDLEDDFMLAGFENTNHYADDHDKKPQTFAYSFLKRASEIVGSTLQIVRIDEIN